MKKTSIVKIGCSFVGVTSAGLCLLAYGVKKTVESLDRIVNTDVLIAARKPTSYIYLNHRVHMEPDRQSEESADQGCSTSTWLDRWSQRKRLVIWRLVEIANSDPCRQTRIRAVDTLLTYSLSASEMATVAQQSNAQTAAVLANSQQADDDMFLKSIPPALTEPELEDKMRDLLIELSKSRRHVCLKYFVSKAFPDYKTISSYFFMGCETSETMKQVLKLSQDNLTLSCLEALVHHCSISHFAADLVAAGGLNVLSWCYRLHGDQPQVCLLLSKLVLSVSLHVDHISHLHRTGWLRILSTWSRCKDSRLGALSACALYNLNRTSDEESVFGDEVYLLHPRVRTSSQPHVDVVLLHGLLGGLFLTWRQRCSNEKHLTFSRLTTNEESTEEKGEESEMDLTQAQDEYQDQVVESDFEFVLSDLPVSDSNSGSKQSFSFPWEEAVRRGVETRRADQGSSSWPMDWLAKDCCCLRLVGVNYDTRISAWLPRCPLKERSLDKSISCKSEDLLSQLTKADVGSRPLVWVAHSMGGLLLKHILIQASCSADEEVKALVNNTRSIVFLSTPHKGSPLASLSEASRFLLQTPRYISELRMDSPELLKLHRDFLEFLDKNPVEVVTFLETKTTRITSLNIEIQCVPPRYADPQTGEIYEIPVGHVDICKPDSKLSFIYQKILSVVTKVSEETKEKLKQT